MSTGPLTVVILSHFLQLNPEINQTTASSDCRVQCGESASCWVSRQLLLVIELELLSRDYMNGNRNVQNNLIWLLESNRERQCVF
jgi:hypothetical protein